MVNKNRDSSESSDDPNKPSGGASLSKRSHGKTFEERSDYFMRHSGLGSGSKTKDVTSKDTAHHQPSGESNPSHYRGLTPTLEELGEQYNRAEKTVVAQRLSNESRAGFRPRPRTRVDFRPQPNPRRSQPDPVAEERPTEAEVEGQYDMARQTFQRLSESRADFRPRGQSTREAIQQAINGMDRSELVAMQQRLLQPDSQSDPWLVEYTWRRIQKRLTDMQQ